jgi:hypothetical protein
MIRFGWNTLRAALGIVAAVWMLWAIAYRLILGFTPIWLDVLTYGGACIAMLVAWIVGRNNKFDYSRKVEGAGDQSTKHL